MPAQPVPVNVPLIGGSGYIGGSVLSQLCFSPSTPSARVSVLVRDPEAAKAISSAYPMVRVLLGDLSNDRLLREAAAAADVVIYAARNTQDGVESLMTGLVNGSRDGDGTPEQSSGPPRRPPLFIMLSAIISLADPKNLRLGEAPLESAKPMSDVDDKDELMGLPEHHWHVAQERAFLRLAAEKGRDAVTPVVMGLPFAVGNGAGPVRTRGFVHDYAAALLRRQSKVPFVMGRGRNVWSWSSPRDVASAIVFVVSQWIRAENVDDLRGYFFVESGQLQMGELARCVSTVLAGDDQPSREEGICDSLQYPQFAELMPELPGLWGVSARCKADRLKSRGWRPVETQWQPLVEECVRHAAGGS